MAARYILVCFSLVLFSNFLLFWKLDKLHGKFHGHVNLESVAELTGHEKDMLPAFENWLDCISKEISQVNPSFVQSMRKCFTLIHNVLHLVKLPNSDEIKYHAVPIQSGEKSTILSLGIGNDIRSEAQLQSRLTSAKSEFFGADPIPERNKMLYEHIGTYFQIAVGAKDGMANASVLIGNKYEDRVFQHMNIITFLKTQVQRTFIDQMFIDIEGAEYDMFPFFFKEGEFDRNGITVCQFNMKGPRIREMMPFLSTLVDDRRYAFFGVNVGHFRLYFINMDNDACVEKYAKR